LLDDGSVYKQLKVTQNEATFLGHVDFLLNRSFTQTCRAAVKCNM
jgi:hypothetical protein